MEAARVAVYPLVLVRAHCCPQGATGVRRCAQRRLQGCNAFRIALNSYVVNNKMRIAGEDSQATASAWPPNFHEHVVIVAISRANTFPEVFHVASSVDHPQEILYMIKSSVRDTLLNTDNWYKLVVKRSSHCTLDKSHSVVLQLDFATEIHDAHILCFSCNICAYANKCPDGVFNGAI